MRPQSSSGAYISILEFFRYLGPALIVSMAYMDPGNYGTAIQAGASSGYDLLWAVWLASLFAMLLQYLSGKVGIATGKDLPELIRGSLSSKKYVVTYWLGAEVAAAATDLAEYLGTVLALNILFQIPLLYAAIIGAADVLILLLLTSEKFRTLEYFFMLIISIISIGFLYELFVIGPSPSSIALHSVSPNLTGGNVLFVVGIIGATVMPHALFVHSTLTRNRLREGTIEEKRKLRRLHLAENVSTLLLAGLVNVAILVTAATALYPRFSSVATVDEAYRIMIPLYGPLAATVFALTLLFSGLASSTTGTLAGQAIMEGLLGTRVNKYVRRLITRVINVFPTTLAIVLGLNPLVMLVFSQVALSLLIPLPMIPLLFYSSRSSVMGEFVNRKITTVLALICGAAIIGLNGFLLLSLA